MVDLSKYTKSKKDLEGMVDLSKYTKSKKDLEDALNEPELVPIEDVEMVQGSISMSQSLGEKADDGLVLDNSQSCPTIERTMLTPKEFKAGQYSKTSVNCGMTVSLGNYEFFRCDVGIEEFCRPEEKEATINEMKEMTKELLKNEIQKVKAKNKEKRTKDRERFESKNRYS